MPFGFSRIVGNSVSCPSERSNWDHAPVQLELAGGRSTKASAMEEGVGIPRNAAGLNFHSFTTRMHGEVSEGILRTAAMLSALPLLSTLTRRTTVPVVTLLAGYCGNVAATTSTGSGGDRAGPVERGWVESEGSAGV